jgi:hypothetical protein
MKTAVEWLIKTHFGSIENCTPDFRNKIKQANEIFKQQLNEAMNYDRPFLSCWEDNTAFEEYYNETFKQDETD